MGFEFIKKLPTPDEIRNQYPIDAKIKALKEQMEAALGSVESKEQLGDPINFLQSLVPVLQIMKMLYATIC